MIHEIDQALRTLIHGDLLPGLNADVEFAAPTRDWAARRNAPTINAFLYDIREDDQRRASGRQSVRDDSGRVVRRARPTRWFQLTYLITAWTNRPEDEHRMLSALLGLLLRQDVLAVDDLPPALAQLDVPIPMHLGTPLAESRSVTELWSALGGELKPSLDLTVVVPMPDSTPVAVGPPVTEITIEAHDGREHVETASRRLTERTTARGPQ